MLAERRERPAQESPMHPGGGGIGDSRKSRAAVGQGGDSYGRYGGPVANPRRTARTVLTWRRRLSSREAQLSQATALARPRPRCPVATSARSARATFAASATAA